MIGEQFGVERLLEVLCFGFAFERLDFVGDAPVGVFALPLGFWWQRLFDVGPAAKFETQFRGCQTFASVVIALP